MTCASSDSYVVAYNSTSEVIDSYEDEYSGTLYTTRTVYDCYVLNDKGNVIFQTQYTVTEADMDYTSYEGAYIASCNEGRIITYTSDYYFFGASHAPMTVNIYNLQGTRLAQVENVVEVGTYINGKLLLCMENSELLVLNKNGETLYQKDIRGEDEWGMFSFPSNTWVSDGFIDGYILLTNWSGDTVLVSDDLSKTYKLPYGYVSGYNHSGTLVASKIVTGDTLSDKYYLIDLAKCDKDDEGYVIPTMEAAVSSQGYDEIVLTCLFGETAPYALVSRNDKWGYLTLDGSKETLYDDAGSFHNGKAIVVDGSRTYVIDENLKQISGSVTGCTGVSSAANGVFRLTTADGTKIGIFTA